jgi:hypothetical protein
MSRIMNVQQFLELFAATDIQTSETVEYVEVKCHVKKLALPNDLVFVEGLSFLNKRDSLSISITVGESESVDFVGGEPSRFLADVNDHLEIAEEGEIS